MKSLRRVRAAARRKPPPLRSTQNESQGAKRYLTPRKSI